MSNLSIFFYQYFFYHWLNCNIIRLLKSSFVFLFIYSYITSNINIYVKINFYLLHLSRYDYCIYTYAQKGVFIIRSMMLVNVIQHRQAVGNFNSHFKFDKLKSKSDSLLGIYPLLKKIVHVLMFYILSHVVPGLLTFSDGLLTGKFHRKTLFFPINFILLLNQVTWLHAFFMVLH